MTKKLFLLALVGIVFATVCGAVPTGKKDTSLDSSESDPEDWDYDDLSSDYEEIIQRALAKVESLKFVSTRKETDKREEGDKKEPEKMIDKSPEACNFSIALDKYPNNKEQSPITISSDTECANIEDLIKRLEAVQVGLASLMKIPVKDSKIEVEASTPRNSADKSRGVEGKIDNTVLNRTKNSVEPTDTKTEIFVVDGRNASKPIDALSLIKAETSTPEPAKTTTTTEAPKTPETTTTTTTTEAPKTPETTTTTTTAAPTTPEQTSTTTTKAPTTPKATTTTIITEAPTSPPSTTTSTTTEAPTSPKSPSTTTTTTEAPITTKAIPTTTSTEAPKTVTTTTTTEAPTSPIMTTNATTKEASIAPEITTPSTTTTTTTTTTTEAPTTPKVTTPTTTTNAPTTAEITTKIISTVAPTTTTTTTTTTTMAPSTTNATTPVIVAMVEPKIESRIDGSESKVNTTKITTKGEEPSTSIAEILQRIMKYLEGTRTPSTAGEPKIPKTENKDGGFIHIEFDDGRDEEKDNGSGYFHGTFFGRLKKALGIS